MALATVDRRRPQVERADLSAFLASFSNQTHRVRAFHPKARPFHALFSASFPFAPGRPSRWHPRNSMNPFPHSSSAIRFAAICTGLSAITTFLLWWLPRQVPPPQDFAQAVALHANPYHLARLWVNFVHIFLALAGYAAAAALWMRRMPGLAVAGFLCFFGWGLTELLGVSANLFAVNGTWRAQYAAADPALQQILRTQITGFAAVWHAMFFLLLVFFLLGTLSLGLAAWRGRGLERAVGVLLLLAVPLTLVIMLGGYTNISTFSAFVGWVYPVLQPISRATLAVWLWQQARSA
jgi:hypothetical protein